MAKIDLTILSPANGAVFKDGDLVSFVGQASVPQGMQGLSLYFRWYSSLRRLVKDAQDKVSQFSVNTAALTDASAPFAATLPMGSHVITFAASDQAQEADIAQSRHGAAAGGVNLKGVGHVIHVLKASIVAPTDSGAMVTPATRFQAEAPWPFEDDGYQRVNKLEYTWVFDPISGGLPDTGRIQLVAGLDAMRCRTLAGSSLTVLELEPKTYQNLRGRYLATLLVKAGSPPTVAPQSIEVTFP